jgi:hypothetical protein
MAKQIIKIGTKVKVRFFGGETKIAKVTVIEKCECGEKYGEPVDSVTTSQLRGCNYDYTLDHDCERWCYGSQVLSVV